MAASSARPWMPLLVFLSVCVLFMVVSVSAQPPPPPPKFGKKITTVTCTDKKKNITCSGDCPTKCPDSCIISCKDKKCKQKPVCLCDLIPGTICGDPRFTAGDGNNFYFHGKKDHDFCIVSDTDLHINAHFIGNRNPIMNRDFTWIQALGILFGEHRLFVGVQKTKTWEQESDRLVITFDGMPVDIETERNAIWVSSSVPALSITRTSNTNAIAIDLNGLLAVKAHAVPITEKDSKTHNYGLTTEDSLAHFDLSFKFHSLSENVHGVLGQTYRLDYVNKFDVTKPMPVMGGGPNYLSSSIFATDCAVSRFHAKPELKMVTSNEKY